ncbi:MAG: GH3 auxin-responsive promoter family protein [Cytophagales bacterium]
MGIRSLLSKPLAKVVRSQIVKWSSDPVGSQNKVFNELMFGVKDTIFAKDHSLNSVKSYQEFKRKVPVQDYEGFKEYIKRIKDGASDVLWKGLPIYFAKTSGTTSGIKYIPITKESIPHHINSARNALLCYIEETGKSQFLDKNLMFLSGSPKLDLSGHVPYGRLSGIVNHHVPKYLRSNQKPSYETNCIEDWETKLEKVIDETLASDMSLISGIPPWVQMYFDRIIERTGKKVGEVFPNFSLYVYGGVNFEPYRAKLFDSIGRRVDSIETYPASEGFIAYQDRQSEEGLLLLLDAGIFYEFIPVSDYFSSQPTRLTIADVELGVNYALVMSTNAGLWGYSIGDTVKFVSRNPYRVVVTGRVKHFLSAFGEHVIGEEVENAMLATLEHFPEVEIVEFTVAPQVAPESGLPYHEWLIEFSKEPNDFEAFVNYLDHQLVKRNTYYDDLITGSILRKLRISVMQKNAFIEYMKSIGKLGGQNKVPRLSNDRTIANAMKPWLVKTI